MKRFLSIVMVLVLCFAMSAVPAFAAESDTSENISPLAARSMGYNSGTGYSGSFTVNVPSSGSSGKVTIRITGPDQNQAVWFKVTDPNGRVVWDHSTLDTVGKMGVLPQNGAEIISPAFSNAVAGNYTVTFTTLVQVTIDCWVYNW